MCLNNVKLIDRGTDLQESCEHCYVH